MSGGNLPEKNMVALPEGVPFANRMAFLRQAETAAEQEKREAEVTDISESSVERKEKDTKERYDFFIKFPVRILLIAAGIYFCLTCILQPYRADGNENSPFVRDGDACIFYRLGTINTGDVVLYEGTDGSLHVGRIAAGPGQEIDIRDTGEYTVNGYLPEEEVAYTTLPAENSSVEYPLALAEDEYFILNDFRSLTDDSRSFGAVSGSSIHGNLLFLFRRRGF